MYIAHFLELLSDPVNDQVLIVFGGFPHRWTLLVGGRGVYCVQYGIERRVEFQIVLLTRKSTCLESS